MLAYILARLREPSTWRGIVALATAAGVQLNPDQLAAVVSAGMAVAGLIAVLSSDKRDGLGD